MRPAVAKGHKVQVRFPLEVKYLIFPFTSLWCRSKARIATQNAMHFGTVYLSTRFPLPNLFYMGYSVKMIYFTFFHNVILV